MLRTITWEDGIVEWMTSLFFFGASFLFFYLYIRSNNDGNNFFKVKTTRNLFYLLLGILFFFGAGEEISWGQRIFNFGTPDILVGANRQGETNIHNLIYTTTLLDSNNLFILFWMIYCLVIPLLNKYFTKLNQLFYKINLPIPPLWIGTLFLTNYLMYKIVYKSWNLTPRFPAHYAVQETKEMLYGFICYVLAAQYILQKSRDIMLSSKSKG